MKRYVVTLGCGCCEDFVWFTSDEAIQKAWDKAWIDNEDNRSSATVVLEDGDKVNRIDLFYGYSEDEEEQGNKGLDYLAKLAGLSSNE